MSDNSVKEKVVSPEQAAEAEKFKESANVYFKSMLIIYYIFNYLLIKQIISPNCMFS